MAQIDSGFIIGQLQEFPGIVQPFFRSFGSDATWRPDDKSWSALEVMAHLADEEVLDLRTRLELTLAGDVNWPPIDPEGWVTERNYNAMNSDEVLDRFCRERATSVRWLLDLGEVDWNTSVEDPRYGKMRAGDMLLSWTVHDTLHLRQLSRLRFQLAEERGVGYVSLYAGSW